MKEKYVILRNISPSAGVLALGKPAGGGVAAAIPLPPLIAVEVEAIDRKDHSAMLRRADVEAAAPAIPMKLIAPKIDREDVAIPAALEIEWGVKAVKADTSPFTGDGVVVAVLDTGIDAAHPAFAGMDIEEKDFTGEGNGDTHGHGTHCAGVIFGRTTGNRRIGVAPGVKKALIGKVLGREGGGSDQIVEAIQWAVKNGANVISMSLGMDFPGLVKRLENSGIQTEAAVSIALEDYRENVNLFESLASLIKGNKTGVIIVAAAGNESERPRYEIAVSLPAVCDGIISIAAIGQASNGFSTAPFSNTGANISGPGVNVVSAKRGGGFIAMSGTSMATPHVAGVAALWAEKINKGIGSLNTLELTTDLLGSATRDGMGPGFDPSDVGLGLIQAPQR